MIGCLYVVATPVGNLSDVSDRCLSVLRQVDFVACEDTRVSVVLLNHFGIKKKLVSYHKFNEIARSSDIIRELLDGKSCALITDAGTPCISDPGHIVVSEAVSNKIPVIGVPGACAAITALSVSGIKIDCYAFYGFFPKNNGEILGMLNKDGPEVCVFYESPARIKNTVRLLSQVFENAEVCLCNDLTKKFEAIYRGSPGEVLEELESNEKASKGEYTLVLKKNKTAVRIPEEKLSIEAMLVDIIVKEDVTLKDAISLLNERVDRFSKKDIYSASLSLKKLLK